jgi:hypothetical protein
MILVLFKEFQFISNFILEELGRFLVKAFLLNDGSDPFFEFEMIAAALAYIEMPVQLLNGCLIQFMIKIFIELTNGLFASHLPIPFPVTFDIDKVKNPSYRFQSPLLAVI